MFDVRNTENFNKDPFIEALTKNNPELLKTLKGTSNRTDFIMLLIKNISKAYEENNKDILQKLPEYIKRPGIMATFTDNDIYKPTKQELKNPDALNKNVYHAASENTKKEKEVHDIMKQERYYSRSVGVENNNYVIDLMARLHYYSKSLNLQNIDSINQFRNNPGEAVQKHIKNDIHGQYDDKFKNALPFVVIEDLLPKFGKTVSETTQLGHKTLLGVGETTFPNSPENLNPSLYNPGAQRQMAKTKHFSDIDKELRYWKERQKELENRFSSGITTGEMAEIVNQMREVSKNIQRLQPLVQQQENLSNVRNPNTNSRLPILTKEPPFISINKMKELLNINAYPSQYRQRNTEYSNAMYIGMERQLSKNNTITVNNHNQFTMTFNGKDNEPNNAMSVVKRQLSSMSAESINLYLGIKR